MSTTLRHLHNDVSQRCITLEGVAQGTDGAVIAGYVEATYKDRVQRTRMKPGEFDLAVDGFGTVRVEIADAGDVQVLGESLTGPWWELADSPLGRLFAEEPWVDLDVHGETRLKGWVLRSGDRVAVKGVVIEDRFEAAMGNYREAPVSRPARVKAVALGIGAHSLAKLESAEAEARKPRDPRKPREPRKARAARARRKRLARPFEFAPKVLAVIGLVCASAFVLGPRSSWLSVPAVLSPFLLYFALSFALRRHWPPIFISEDDIDEVKFLRFPFSWPSEEALILIICIMVYGLIEAFAYKNATPFIAIAASVIFQLVDAGVIAVRERHFRRDAQALLKAPRLGSNPQPGRWGVIEGTIDSSTSATVLEQAWRVRRTGDNRSDTENVVTVRTAEWFTVNIGKRVTVMVDPRKAIFAADRRTFSRRISGRYPFFNSVLADFTDSAQTGDAVMVLGRVRQNDSSIVFQSTKYESLLVFATRHASARKRLKSLWLMSWLRVGTMLAVAGAMATLAWWCFERWKLQGW